MSRRLFQLTIFDTQKSAARYHFVNPDHVEAIEVNYQNGGYVFLASGKVVFTKKDGNLDNLINYMEDRRSTGEGA